MSFEVRTQLSVPSSGDLTVSFPPRPAAVPPGVLLTGPRGGILDRVQDSDFARTLHGVIEARALLSPPHEPTKVVLRIGKDGLMLPLGGGLDPGDTPVHCALRECQEEGKIQRILRMRLLTVLSREGADLWIDRERWDSWGYAASGRRVRGEQVSVGQIRTAVFVGELAEPFRSRTAEGRIAKLIDLREIDISTQVRPAFRFLLKQWLSCAGNPNASFPSYIRQRS